MRERLRVDLTRRELVAPAPHDDQTIYGKPLWRPIIHGHEPQALMDASTRARDLVALAHATPATGCNLCAAWVERVFSGMRLGVVTGDAATLCRTWCTKDDTAELMVGMIIATAAHPYSADGRAWGHVGLYIGDRCVMDCAGGRVRTTPLEAWISVFGVMSDVRWGWLGGIALT